MRSKLLAVAIATGLGMVSLQAAAAQKSHTTGASQAELEAQKAQIQTLKAQLEALQAKMTELEQRTDAQSDINVSTGQAVEKTTSSQADTDAKLAALEKSIGNTTLGGKMYFDFSNIDQKNSDSGKTDASGLGVDVKRFYLSATHQFNDIWSANLTTDFNYVGSDGETNLFVKKAYVQGKFNPGAVLRVGSADMPWIPFVEGQYGFRYIEPTITDRLHFANSADWGVHLGGDLGGKTVNYAVSMVNGGGYKHPGRSKGVDFEGRVGFAPVDGLMLAVGAYSGNRGQETQSVNAVNTAQRYDFLVNYGTKAFNVGGEYFSAKDWNQVLSPLSDKADGYSLWGSVALAEDIALFARYDSAKLSKDLDRDAKDTFYDFGVQYQVTKGFKLAGVWKHEKAQYSVTAPVPPHVQNLKTNEIGVYGEVAF